MVRQFNAGMKPFGICILEYTLNHLTARKLQYFAAAERRLLIILALDALCTSLSSMR